MKHSKERRPHTICKAPFIALLLSLLACSIGIGFGEPSRVLEQARQICLACIGIG